MRSRCHVALLAGLLTLLACGSPVRPTAKPPLTLERVAMPGNLKVPFSAAVRAGPMIYLSGQLGTDSIGHIVPGGIGSVTAQALRNIRALLAEQGSGIFPLAFPRGAPSAPPHWPWGTGGAGVHGPRRGRLRRLGRRRGSLRETASLV
jgi:hypothetical protein